jgi:hypothetical protein
MRHPALLALSAGALALALVGAPVVLSAQPAPAPTMVPISKPDFSSMMFLTGTWNCSQMLRGKTRPDTSTTSLGMNGMWMVSQDVAPPFDQYRTVAVNSTTYMGYDSTAKQWVSIGVDDTGGYGTQSSPGWQGSVITWSGKGLDGSTFTDIITKDSDTKTTDQNTVTDPQGKVTKTTITCMKAS